MDGFNTHFGWDTASQSQIDKETGLINGKLVSLMIRFDKVIYCNGKHLKCMIIPLLALFGAGAAVGALFAPYLFNGRGRKSTM